MAIDKNTTQINNFSKGMNTDTSDAYLEDGQYRMAINLRYTTSVGSNSGELHMIEGCTNLIEGNGQIVKKATQLRDTGIIVAEDDNGWYVYTFKEDSTTLKTVAKVLDKSRVVGKNISIVCRYEDEDNQKLYIADGVGSIIVVQLTEELGPNDESNLNQMLAYPAALLPLPKFSGLITGNLRSGVYQYSYQLYKKHAGQSEISVATKMIPLHKGEPSYTSAWQSEGYDKDVQTDKGIKITIPTSNTDTFDSIYIYRIHYKEVGQVPDIDVVYDDKLPKTGDIVFSDSGVKSMSVVSLEEYNAITGIHIIPSIIEAKDDFMFAANIKSDAPIYDNEEIRNWKPYDIENGIAPNSLHANVKWKFTTSTLIGDTCASNDSIKIDYAPEESVNTILTSAEQRGFVGDINDDNNTYANAYIQYTLKSLRRGETYRYGIILYDENGNASAVKHIGDIQTPAWSQNVPFEYSEGKLNIKPLGIQFTVNLPTSAKKYEIVRCGRDLSDISTITQCVLSRPIQRVFEQTFDDVQDGEIRPQGDFPLTPTGLVTTQDFLSWVPSDGRKMPGTQEASTAWDEEYTNIATNKDIIDVQDEWDVSGNKDIFQIISPEYSYQSETLKDILYNVELDIQPISFIYPNSEIIQNVYWCAFAVGGSGSLDQVKEDYYSIGNQFAHFPVHDGTIAIDSRGGTILSYYTDKDTLSHYTVTSDYSPSYTVNPASTAIFASAPLGLSFIQNDDFDYKYKTQAASRHSYIKLYNSTPIVKDIIKIKSIGFPDTLGWDDFASSQQQYQLKYIDKVCSVGGKNFVNWVANGMYGLDHSNEAIEDSWHEHYKIDQSHLDDKGSIVGAMMGPGGKCFVAKLDSQQLAGIEGEYYFGTYLCNIKHNVTPYGGTSKVAIENSTYRSFGNLFDSANNTCKVFDGDCYIVPFEYVSQHKWYHPYLASCRNACVVYSIPMETNINIPYSCGYEFSKHIGDAGISNIQDQPSNVNNIFVQDKPLYAYDTINNTVPTAKILIAESDEEDMYDKNMDYRVYHSEKKSNNERIDNWLMYKPADYIDVDNRYGAITGLRKFNNSLVFWQQTGAGILQVNERAQITDDSNMPLILGTGGVLGRYDYINTKNGMREGEFADAQSDNMLYWWDHDKKQILSYTSGVMAQELSKIKFVQNFFTNCNDIDNPVLFFDKQNNEAVFNVSTEGSMVFNENTGAFTGLYQIKPSGVVVLPSTLFLVSNDNSVKRWNSLDSTGVVGLNGEELIPRLMYIINANALMTKTFDNVEFAGRIYGGGNNRTHIDDDPLKNITFDFYTPLKQHGSINGSNIDNTEYNFRFAVPRADDAVYGGRLRGKTMEAVMQSNSNNYDFSLQFILTKYRISWT